MNQLSLPISLVVALLLILTCNAQIYRFQSVIPAIGNNVLTKFSFDPFSQLNNPSSVSDFKTLAISIYGEKHLQVKNISRFASASSFPIKNAAGGFSVTHFSSPGFKESIIGFSYGRILGKANLGICFNYARMSMVGYGNDGGFWGDAGVTFSLSPTITTGISVSNPNRAKLLSGMNGELPFRFSMGIGFHPSELITAELVLLKSGGLDMEVRSFVHYQHARSFYARIGFLSSNSVLVAGAGWEKGHFRLMITVTYQNGMQFAPGILLSYTQPGASVP